jgi:hypothetical protein
VKRFVSYADGVPAFEKITSEAEKPNAYSALMEMDQEDTCYISHAADLCKMLTNGLTKLPEVCHVSTFRCFLLLQVEILNLQTTSDICLLWMN